MLRLQRMRIRINLGPVERRADFHQHARLLFKVFEPSLWGVLSDQLQWVVIDSDRPRIHPFRERTA